MQRETRIFPGFGRNSQELSLNPGNECQQHARKAFAFPGLRNEFPGMSMNPGNACQQHACQGGVFQGMIPGNVSHYWEWEFIAYVYYVGRRYVGRRPASGQNRGLS